MANIFCEYCGTESSTISSLTANSCHRNPNGGKHKLYEGSAKSKYSCKYCGTTSSTISSLTSNSCHRHPIGSGKGKHSPAL